MKEKTLMQIANGLSANLQIMKGSGLLRGKMGALVYLYHYARYSGCASYSDLANHHLSDIFMTGYNHPLSFTTGITGIGWGFHYLIREGFITGNENIWRDIENGFYRFIQQSVNEDMLDCGLYFARCRPELVNEPLSSALSKQIAGFLASGNHTLGQLNKAKALAFSLPVEYYGQLEKPLYNAVLSAIERRFYRLSDMIFFTELLKTATVDNIVEKNLYDRCASALRERDLRKDRLETVWQHLVLMDGTKNTGCDPDWAAARVEEILQDMKEEDMYLSGGLPAIGLDILWNETL